LEARATIAVGEAGERLGPEVQHASPWAVTDDLHAGKPGLVSLDEEWDEDAGVGDYAAHVRRALASCRLRQQPTALEPAASGAG